MWEGYVAFAGSEVVNTERARALAAAAGVYWWKNQKYPQLANALGLRSSGLSKIYLWASAAGASSSYENDSDGTSRTNLCSNPSGEQSANGWVGIPGTTGVMAALTNPSPGNTSFGTDVIHGQWTTASTALGGGLSIDIPVTALLAYSFSVNHVLSSIINQLQLQVEWRTASATISMNTSAPQVMMAANVALENNVNFNLLNVTAPATATIARLKIISVAGISSAQWSIGSFLELDGVQAEQTTTLGTYFDGDTTDIFSIADPMQAPWYDPDLDDLGRRFFGVYGLQFTSLMDSTRQVATFQNASNGLVLGLNRKSGRQVKVKATLLARGRDALEYGESWLSATLDLSGCTQTDDCDKGDVQFFTDIPIDTTTASTLTRLMKQSEASDGPIRSDEFESRGIFGVTVEFIFTSELPYLYALSRDVVLTLNTALALVQDAPINYVPYPAAALEETAVGYTRPEIARNMMLNPSLETNVTGWTAAAVTGSGTSPASYFTSGRSTVDVAAQGTACMLAKIAGNGATSVTTSVSTLSITATTDITGVPAGRKVKPSIWVGKSILAGSGTLMGALSVTYQFFNGATPLGSPTAMVADSRGDGFYESPAVPITATATLMVIVVSSSVTWTSGNTDATNSDARLYADLASVLYYGAV